MNTRDIFNGGALVPDQLANEKGFLNNDTEIPQLAEQQRKFLSGVDFSKISSFAKFGSAVQYYADAVQKIVQYFPYDGSSTDKLKWINSLTDFEFYLFQNEIPRSVGSVKIAADQNIQVYSTIKDLNAEAKKSYLLGDMNLYNTFIDFEEGITFETWAKADDLNLTDILTIKAITEDNNNDPFVIDLLKIYFENNKMHVLDATPNDYELDCPIELDKWHHYAFNISTDKINFFIDGELKVQLSNLEINLYKKKSVIFPFGLSILKLNKNIELPSSFGNTPIFTLGGNNLIYLDETRLWNGFRSIEKIGRFWFTQVDGNDTNQGII
jgi:hypothetical protein